MIKDGLKYGDRLEAQGDIYLAQMAKMEKSIARILALRTPNSSTVITDTHLTAWVNDLGDMGQSAFDVGLLWYVNVWALLILKRIENDNENGILYMQYR